uniref:Uncharacterized protein n=1 Tax=Ditylenchus dipsaci TaxID=166011 RepID=A0A915CU61_9BILA
MAYVENDRYYAGCVQPSSNNQPNTSVLLGDKYRTKCTSMIDSSEEQTICAGEPVEVCCCNGIDCFDELRKQFSSGKSSSQATCKIFRQEFGADADNSPGSDINQMSQRKTCSLCKTIADGRGVEFGCVPGGQVDEQCKDYTNFVGGSLACNIQGTQCCCRGEKCAAEFQTYYFENGENLPKCKLSAPYTEEENSKEESSGYGPSSSARCSATPSSIIPT